MLTQPCELYRLYDCDDRLLYVGVSVNVVNRMQQHSTRPPWGKAWWPDVAYCALEEFAHTGYALDAERQAIKAERPQHNHRSRAKPVHSGLGWPSLTGPLCR